ncbi:MAG: phospholipase A [Thermodesulfobacteriota bacterium]
MRSWITLALLFVSMPAFTAAAEEPKKYRELDELFTLYQPYLGNISAYQPMYFLLGTQPEKSKFQFSFKYRFFNPDGSLAGSQPWVKGIHFAYTQTSFWDLKSDSKPFEDTSYKPEFFFLSSGRRFTSSEINRVFLQAGYQHESNGRGGEYSRATDQLYIKPHFIWLNEKSKLGIQAAPKLWWYISNENKELPDYRGYFDLEIKCGKADSLVVETHLRWAREGGSGQVDATYPLNRFFFKNLDLYLHLQYVNCLAESLLHFTERTHALRIGFSVIR